MESGTSQEFSLVTDDFNINFLYITIIPDNGETEGSAEFSYGFSNGSSDSTIGFGIDNLETW
jgi:hypothetical protein